MSFWRELRRRNIFRVAFTYGVVAWLLIQVVNNVAAPLDLPAWTPTLVIVLLGVGFPVALILAWAFELTPEGVKRSSEADETVAAAPALGRKWDFVIIGGLVVALGYFVWQGQGASEAEQTARGEEVAGASVAVLPFADHSPEGDQDHFSDGVSQEIHNALARIEDLDVAGFASSSYFKGRDEDVRTVAEQLDVAHLLTGSVRRSEDDLRITAELIEARSSRTVLSRTYDRTLDEIFAIQDEIARAVAESLQVTLGVGELGRQAGMTRDVRAYEAYLRGRVLVDASSLYEEEIAALQRAVEIDPSFALAWARLARVYGTRINFDDPANVARWRGEMADAVARARDLAPEASAVLRESAHLASLHGNYVEAERLFRRALELHDDPALLLGFGEFLLDVGKAEEAIRYLEQARRREPLWADIPAQLGLAYACAGRFQDALAEFDRGDEAVAGAQNMLRAPALMTALMTGAQIEHRFDLLLETDPSEDVGMRVFSIMRGHLDMPEAARRELRRLYEEDPESPLGQYVIAFWAAYFSDSDLAFMALRRAVRLDGSLHALWRPNIADVRKLPGFEELVHELDLVEYWRETGWGDFCRPIAENDLECE